MTLRQRLQLQRRAQAQANASRASHLHVWQTEPNWGCLVPIRADSFKHTAFPAKLIIKLWLTAKPLILPRNKEYAQEVSAAG
jgi:hypothetical protein